MAKKKDTTNPEELLLECMSQSAPMLSLLDGLCRELMEAEMSAKLGTEKSPHSAERTGSRSGYRPRRLDTRMGNMYLMVPRVRSGGYIPSFVTKRKRSETRFNCQASIIATAIINSQVNRKTTLLPRKNDR